MYPVGLMTVFVFASMRIGKIEATIYLDPLCLPDKCNSIRIGVRNSQYPGIECCTEHCSCGKTVCHTRNSTCASADRIFLNKMEPLTGATVGCVRPQLRHSTNYPSQKATYYMNKQCWMNYYTNMTEDASVASTVDKCENAETHSDLDTRVPVSDRRTGLVYQNIFCAICNDVPTETMAFWTPRISCQNESFLPESYEMIVEGILKTRSCNILYEPPSEQMAIPYCTLLLNPICNNGTIVKCFIDKNSNEVVCLFDIFQCRLRITVDPLHGFLVTFSLLLSYTPFEQIGAVNLAAERSHHQQSNIVCNEGTFLDKYKNVCREITCVPPKALRHGRCQNLVLELLGLSISFHLKITPQPPVPIAEANVVSDSIVEVVNLVLQRYSFNKHLNISSYSKLNTTQLYNFADADSVMLYYVVTVDAAAVYDDVAVDAGLIDAILAFDKTLLSPNLPGYEFFVELIKASKSGFSEAILYNAVDDDILILYKSYEIDNLIDYPDIQTTNMFLLPTTGCPLVTINHTEFDMQHFSWGVRLKEIEADITLWDMIETVVSGQVVSISVCVDAYSDIINTYLDSQRNTSLGLNGMQMTVAFENSDKSDIGGIMSFVCIFMSVICLVMTLITYGLFKEMRTQPGVNNMALCTSLIFAQLFFQLGIGQKQTVSSEGCKAIGILIHFFSLNSIMWMNVCSIHSLKIFWSIAKIQNSTMSFQTTLLYFVYSFVGGLLPVISNIISNVLASNGDPGYGKVVCYISEKTNMLWTFAFPAFIIILVNIALFIAVIVKVKVSSSSSRAAKDKQYFRVYVKLSSLTGCLWVFGFVYMFTGEPVLAYLFVIFNTSQGVFIFISFICNRTCLKKYLGLWRKYTSHRVGSATTKVTHTGSPDLSLKS